MAVFAEDFLSPTGLIEARSMFPGQSDEELIARMDAYIEEGQARTTSLATDLKDAAVTAWVYYRAFFAVYLELSANPASAAMSDQGSTLYTSYQIANFKELSDQFLKDFEGYVTSEVPLNIPLSFSVSHKIAYR